MNAYELADRLQAVFQNGENTSIHQYQCAVIAASMLRLQADELRLLRTENELLRYAGKSEGNH